MSQKIDSYLTFALLSKKIIFGEALINKLPSNRVHLIVLANDIGESQKKKFLDKAKFYNVSVLFYKSKEEIASLLHKGSVSALGILDSKLAKAILNAKEADLID